MAAEGVGDDTRRGALRPEQPLSSFLVPQQLAALGGGGCIRVAIIHLEGVLHLKCSVSGVPEGMQTQWDYVLKQPPASEHLCLPALVK